MILSNQENLKELRRDMEAEPTESQSMEKKAGFIARLFRGDVSLPITYWVFGVLIGNVAFQIIFKIIEFNYLKITSSQAGVWSVMAFNWFVIGYRAFLYL